MLWHLKYNACIRDCRGKKAQIAWRVGARMQWVWRLSLTPCAVPDPHYLIRSHVAMSSRQQILLGVEGVVGLTVR
jgi:hypothetical protein